MTNDHPEQAALLSDAELGDAAERVWETMRDESWLISTAVCSRYSRSYHKASSAGQAIAQRIVFAVLSQTVPAILRDRANRIDADPKHIGVDLWPLEDLADELEAMGGGAQ